jgi:hypothetical protein
MNVNNGILLMRSFKGDLFVKIPDEWEIKVRQEWISSELCMFYKDDFEMDLDGKPIPRIIIYSHAMEEETDKGFITLTDLEISRFKMYGWGVEKINKKYKQRNRHFTFNVDNGLFFNRMVFTRYEDICLEILLLTDNQEQRTDLSTIVDEILNNIKFSKHKKGTF